MPTPNSRPQKKAHWPEGKRRLPFASRAQIPTEPGKNKLKDYILDPNHKDGSHKARMFRNKLGIEQDDWEDLRNQILTKLPECWVRCVVVKWVPHQNLALRPSLGFEVYVPVDGTEGRSCMVLTAWHFDVRCTPFFATARPQDPPD